MNEPSLTQRIVMVIRTLASIVTWVVALGVSLVRGKLRGPSRDF